VKRGLERNRRGRESSGFFLAQAGSCGLLGIELFSSGPFFHYLVLCGDAPLGNEGDGPFFHYLDCAATHFLGTKGRKLGGEGGSKRMLESEGHESFLHRIRLVSL